MTKLDKCPNVLCGSEDVDVKSHWEYAEDLAYGYTRHEYSYTVRCKSCNAETKKRTYECDAVKLWHDRPQVVDVEKVIEMLDEISVDVFPFSKSLSKSIDIRIDILKNGGYDATAD